MLNFIQICRINAHCLYPAATWLDFIHLDISVYLRNSSFLLIAESGKVCFSLLSFNIKGVKTPVPKECWGTEEKDRENLKVIKLSQSQQISSEAKTETGLIFYRNVCYKYGLFLLDRTFMYLSLPITADNTSRALFAKNGRQNFWKSSMCTAGQLTVHISFKPQQWILILTSTKSKSELCSFQMCYLAKFLCI